MIGLREDFGRLPTMMTSALSLPIVVRLQSYNNYSSTSIVIDPSSNDDDDDDEEHASLLIQCIYGQLDLSLDSFFFQFDPERITHSLFVLKA